MGSLSNGCLHNVLQPILATVDRATFVGVVLQEPGGRVLQCLLSRAYHGTTDLPMAFFMGPVCGIVSPEHSFDLMCASYSSAVRASGVGDSLWVACGCCGRGGCDWIIVSGRERTGGFAGIGILAPVEKRSVCVRML